MMFTEKVRQTEQGKRATLLVQEISGRDLADARAASVLNSERGLNDLKRMRVVITHGGLWPIIELQRETSSAVRITSDGTVTNKTLEQHSSNAYSFLQDVLGLNTDTPVSYEELGERYKGISVEKTGMDLVAWFDKVVHEIIRTVKLSV